MLGCGGPSRVAVRWEAADGPTTKKMRAVRQTGTSPELAVRAALRGLGISFAVNVADKPGRPDIWLTAHDVPIFVHGCFWHRHAGCRRATIPRKNRAHWMAKFQQNKERDARKVEALKRLGFQPVTVWQCETTDAAALTELLIERLAAVGAGTTKPR